MYKKIVVFPSILCASLLASSALHSAELRHNTNGLREDLIKSLSSSRVFGAERPEVALTKELETIQKYRTADRSKGLQQLLFEAVVHNKNFIQKIIAAGAHPDKPLTKSDKSQSAPLHLAVFINSHEAVEELLQQEARVNARDTQGETPLHIATEKQYNTLIPRLIKAGALIDARNTHGTTPLLIATSNDNLLGIQLLLGAGANQWGQSNTYGSAPFNIVEAKALTKEASEVKRNRNQDIYHAFIQSQLQDCITEGNPAELRTLTEKYQCRPPLLFARALILLEKQRKEKEEDTYQQELLEDMKTILETHLSKNNS